MTSTKARGAKRLQNAAYLDPRGALDPVLRLAVAWNGSGMPIKT